MKLELKLKLKFTFVELGHWWMLAAYMFVLVGEAAGSKTWQGLCKLLFRNKNKKKLPTNVSKQKYLLACYFCTYSEQIFSIYVSEVMSKKFCGWSKSIWMRQSCVNAVNSAGGRKSILKWLVYYSSMLHLITI